MALWGNNDSVYSAGTVTDITDAGVVTGSGTTWTSGNGVVPGLVITLGSSNGSGVIKSVDSATQVTLVDTVGFTTVAGGSLTYNISEQPVYLPTDSNWGGNEIYGVDATEVGLAATTAYAVGHSGWVGLTTYTDMHGNLRVKHEVFVAGGILTTTDAEDDTFFPE
jgi:hypothetical protein